MTQTQRILKEMLTENTGTHMLDSGGAYGRNWERNQSVDLDSQPASTVEFSFSTNGNGKDYNEIMVSHNVYHWLDERLEYDRALDSAFRVYCEEHQDESPYYLMEPFAVKLGGKGIYGEGDPIMVNTYNGEDLLSQVLQYCYFEIDGTAYVLLQIHGGCDVRGGYTDPRVFKAFEDGLGVFANADAVISCDNCDANWSTDDSCHWYYDGGTGNTELQEYDFTDDIADRGHGQVYCDDDKKGYCPKCGGKLEACF